MRLEIFWTTLWFTNQEEKWKNNWDRAVEPGHKAYTEKQKSIWERFQKRTCKQFSSILGVDV